MQSKRTPEGFYAYSEFLVGLETINQQEFVMPGKSGANLRKDAFQGRNALLNELGPKGVNELANWERQIRQRAETVHVMKYSENLLRRSRMDKQKEMESCEHGVPVCVCV
jgi:hypothetical protein